MDNLPFELLQLISYNLPINILSINKHYLSLYDDEWYNNYLQHNYKIIGDKKLYYKSLKTGVIYKTNKNTYEKIKLPILGIKAASIKNSDSSLILTFDGKLYINDTLIDTDVVDIDYSCYVTNDTCYILIDENNKEIKKKLEKDFFVKVRSYYGNNIILFTNIQVELINLTLNLSASFKINNIIDLEIINGDAFILKENGDLKMHNLDNKIIQSNVKSINGSLIISTTNETYTGFYDYYKMKFIKYSLIGQKALASDKHMFVKDKNVLKLYDLYIERVCAPSIRLNFISRLEDNIKDIFIDFDYLYIVK